MSIATERPQGTLAKANPRRKSALTLRIEEGYDRMPMTVGCSVDGCDWPGWSGPAKEAREMAREHRREAHPDRPLIARRPKKPKAPRREQTAEDKAIVARLAARNGPAKRQPRTATKTARPDSPNFEALVNKVPRDELERLCVVEKLTQEEAGRRLGFSQAIISNALKRYGLPSMRRRITPEREAAAWKLYAVGLTPTQISYLAWNLWGYRSPDSCRSNLVRRFMAEGRQLRSISATRTLRCEVLTLNRAEALAVLQQAEAPESMAEVEA